MKTTTQDLKVKSLLRKHNTFEMNPNDNMQIHLTIDITIHKLQHSLMKICKSKSFGPMIYIVYIIFNQTVKHSYVTFIFNMIWNINA